MALSFFALREIRISFYGGENNETYLEVYRNHSNGYTGIFIRRHVIDQHMGIRQ